MRPFLYIKQTGGIQNLNIYILTTFKLKYGEYDVIFNGSVKIMINPKISDDHIKRFLKMV